MGLDYWPFRSQFYRGNFAAAEGRGEYLREFQNARMISVTVL